VKNLLGALLAFGLLAGGLRVLYSRVTSAATQDNSTCLVLAGSTTTEENNQTYITGTVRNDCDRRFFTVTVTFKVSLQQPSFAYGNSAYGSRSNTNSNDTLREMIISAHGTNLASGESMQFKTQGFMNMAGYQLESINGF
jgi:hypothetical protein